MIHRKTYYLWVCLCTFTICIQAQNTAIPDANFEQALINLGFDSGPLDQLVPTVNISSITNLDVADSNISDLTGIADFKALSILNCSKNNISSLDISSNTQLTELYCNTNIISTLDVTTLPLLKIFWCDNNQLSELDINKNINLISLVCDANELNYLQTNNNTKLTILSCANNQLNSLNISKNTNLNSLLVNNNELSFLDISNQPILTILNCSFNNLVDLELAAVNKLRVLNCANNSIKQLDLSKNSDLTTLDCNTNDLCLLNLKNGTNSKLNSVDFSFNTNLQCVVVDNVSSNHTGWEPSTFSSYVNSAADCTINVPVDTLNNVVGMSYTLPPLINGNYYTEPSGSGLKLCPGEVINKSQTIFIYNETVCDSNQSFFTVTILGEGFYIPKYFTPNNDGNHDFWQVYDALNLVESIHIFNRNGKLLKSMDSKNLGWNGLYNNQPMPSTDYWYVITLKTKETLKGHFTLKRF